MTDNIISLDALRKKKRQPKNSIIAELPANETCNHVCEMHVDRFQNLVQCGQCGAELEAGDAILCQELRGFYASRTIEEILLMGK